MPAFYFAIVGRHYPGVVPAMPGFLYENYTLPGKSAQAGWGDIFDIFLSITPLGGCLHFLQKSHETYNLLMGFLLKVFCQINSGYLCAGSPCSLSGIKFKHIHKIEGFVFVLITNCVKSAGDV